MAAKSKSYLIMPIGALFAVAILAAMYCHNELQQKERSKALILAVKCNNARVVSSLLVQGADANTRDEPTDIRSLWQQWLDLLRGRSKQRLNAPTALLIALKFGLDSEREILPDNVEVVTALLDHGANVNAKDSNGATPLIIAATGKPDTARLLLERGAAVNAQDSAGRTALMTAVLWDQERICKLLLERGAAVNEQNFEGRTALMIAVNGQHEDIIPLLLHWRADVNIKSKTNETATMDARHKLPKSLPLLEGKR